MWILGNLFSNNPTILYTLDDKKKDNKNNNRNSNNSTQNKNNNVLIEDTDHLKRFFGMRY